MTIDLRRLTQFIAVAEELHFGRAAERLHMTQPPLSMAIQSLESDLGLRLLERTQRRVALTAAGQALLSEARQLLREAHALPERVKAAASGYSGTLRLAFVSSITYAALPEWLNGFRAAHPEVLLKLREATLDVQVAALAAQDIDAGFVLHAPGAVPPGLAAWRASREPMVLAMPQGHPLARASGRRARLPSLLQLPLIIFPRELASSLHDLVLGLYRAHGVQPLIAQEAVQMQTIVNLVSAGMGVAWVPESMMRLQRPGVTYRQVPSARLACDTSLLWRPPASPVVERFVAFVSGRSSAGDRG